MTQAATSLEASSNQPPTAETTAGLAATHAVSVLGVSGALVRVEVNITSALRRFVIVGLPDGVVKEARERVRCAIENSGYCFPKSEVVVSLSPASLPKIGSGFDLSMAVAILAADGQLGGVEITKKLFLGELTLDGQVRAARGAIQAVDLTESNEFDCLILPLELKPIASLLGTTRVHFVSSLIEVCQFLSPNVDVVNSTQERRSYVSKVDNLASFAVTHPDHNAIEQTSSAPDFGDVIGQDAAKRALEIAAAGGHNLFFIGPPGVGKSMLARRLPSILPPPSASEAREIARVYSSRVETLTTPITARPFRSPHHTTSYAGLLGGGSQVTAGELSLAHHGVIFLDELPEFRRDVLEGLREPLETKTITISRAQSKVEFPANTLVIAAMNPCPCGHRDLTSKRCRCSDAEVHRYRTKLSGPLLDRFDLHLWLGGLPAQEILGAHQDDSAVTLNPTSAMASRVKAARAIQLSRNTLLGAGTPTLNSALSGNALRQSARLTEKSVKILEQAIVRLNLSARGYTKILRVARTIADLEANEIIEAAHLLEALSYREPATFFSS